MTVGRPLKISFIWDVVGLSSSICLRTWSFWKGWNFWLFWISKHSNLWLLQIFLFKFQLLEMSVRPLKKSMNIFKHDEKINFLKIWYLDVSWNFEKIDFFSMFFSLATTIATAKLGIFCTSILWEICSESNFV